MLRCPVAGPFHHGHLILMDPSPSTVPALPGPKITVPSGQSSVQMPRFPYHWPPIVSRACPGAIFPLGFVTEQDWNLLDTSAVEVTLRRELMAMNATSVHRDIPNSSIPQINRNGTDT